MATFSEELPFAAWAENTKARFADLFGRQANRAVVSR